MSKKTKTVTKKKPPVRLHEVFEMSWKLCRETNTNYDYNEKMHEFVEKHGVEIIHSFTDADCGHTLNLLLLFFTTKCRAFQRDIISHDLSRNADKAIMRIMLKDLFQFDMELLKEEKH